MGNIEQILIEYGLDEKEAILYVAALSLGDKGMSELARKAGLKRTTAYVVFKSLESRGLMGSFKMKSGLKFVATRPEILVKKAQKQIQELESILPQMKAIEKKSNNQPKITYYEGKQGYIIAAEDSLKTPNTTLRHIGSLAEAHKIVGLDYDSKYYIPNRVEKHISFRAIYSDSQIDDKIKNRNHGAELREIRYVPESYIGKTSMLIYENKIVIFGTKKELITVIVESEEIAESEKKKFDLIWDLIRKDK